MLVEVTRAQDEEDELEFRVEDNISDLELYGNNINELLVRLVLARLISESTGSEAESYNLYSAIIMENSDNPAEQLVKLLESIIQGCQNTLNSEEEGDSDA